MQAAVQAYSQWLERAAPFIVLLLLVFLRHHILGEHLDPSGALVHSLSKHLQGPALSAVASSVCWSSKLWRIEHGLTPDMAVMHCRHSSLHIPDSSHLQVQ